MGIDDVLCIAAAVVLLLAAFGLAPPGVNLVLLGAALFVLSFAIE